MRGFRLGLLVIGVLSFIDCGGKPEVVSVSLSQAVPSYATAVEFVVSLIATEIGPPAAAPTPGGLAGRTCLKLTCTADENEVQLQKTNDACATSFGLLDGSIYKKVTGLGSNGGCATPMGPPVYSKWPPQPGSLKISIGVEDIDSPIADNNAPGVLERIEKSGQLTRTWGYAKLNFNSKKIIPIRLNLQHYIIKAANGSIPTNIHFESQNALTMQADNIADWFPRTFNGEVHFEDHKNGITGNALFRNVVIQKSRCCHPLSGTVEIDSQASDEVTLRSVLEFSDRTCGEAKLTNNLGNSAPVTLSPCSS